MGWLSSIELASQNVKMGSLRLCVCPDHFNENYRAAWFVSRQ